MPAVIQAIFFSHLDLYAREPHRFMQKIKLTKRKPNVVKNPNPQINIQDHANPDKNKIEAADKIPKTENIKFGICCNFNFLRT